MSVNRNKNEKLSYRKGIAMSLFISFAYCCITV